MHVWNTAPGLGKPNCLPQPQDCTLSTPTLTGLILVPELPTPVQPPPSLPPEAAHPPPPTPTYLDHVLGVAPGTNKPLRKWDLIYDQVA